MNSGGKKYRKMLAKLDAYGFICTIIRVSKKNFNFLINGKIEKSFKKRGSANKRIIKLLKQFENQ